MNELVSIVMSSFKRSNLLEYGLASIVKNKPDFAFEIIVVNDGLENDGTENVCKKYSNQLNIRYFFTGQRNVNGIVRRNPAIPNNFAIKKAKGDILILSCPEIVHLNNAIELLVDELANNDRALVIPREMYFDFDGIYTSKLLKIGVNGDLSLLKLRSDHVKMPFLFGVWKKRIIEIGGYDEDFIGIGQEDCDFVNRLVANRNSFVLTDAKIIHLHHGNHCYGKPNWDNPAWEYNNRLMTERKNKILRNEKRNWGMNESINTEIKNIPIEDVFTKIYKNNEWNSKETKSGTGSEFSATASQRATIPKIFEKYGIKRILDIGCGDVNWIKYLWGKFEYYKGIDIVEELINNNIKNHSKPGKVEFEYTRVENFDIDKYNFDVVIMNDVLVHLSFNDIHSILNTLRKSNVKYILLTNYTATRDNVSIISGKWRLLNMCEYPFFFNKPLDIIPIVDQYDYKVRNKRDKTLGLWKIGSEVDKINKIPKIAHLFWDDRPMSLLQVFTVTSFHEQNPDWKIIIHKPLQRDLSTVKYVAEYFGSNYFDVVKGLPYVKIHSVNIADYGINEGLHSILRSDILRYYLLYNIGGVWTDFDVLWLRPIEKLFDLKSIGKVGTKDLGTFVCRNEFMTGFNNISVMISAPKHPFYRKMIDTCLEIQNSTPDLSKLQHQAFGTTLMDSLWKTAQDTINEFDDVVAFPYHTFYPYSIFNMEELFKMVNVVKALNPETLCVHWWNGHKLSKEYTNNMNEPVDCTMTRLVQLMSNGII